MYNSRLTFPGFASDAGILAAGDSVRLGLSGAIMRYAGRQGAPETAFDPSLQDEVLSNPNLVADKAQRAYVSKRRMDSLKHNLTSAF